MIHDCIALQINDIFSISMIISEVGCVDSFNWRYADIHLYADIYLLRKSLTMLENLSNHFREPQKKFLLGFRDIIISQKSKILYHYLKFIMRQRNKSYISS